LLLKFLIHFYNNIIQIIIIIIINFIIYY